MARRLTDKQAVILRRPMRLNGHQFVSARAMVRKGLLRVKRHPGLQPSELLLTEAGREALAAHDEKATAS